MLHKSVFIVLMLLSTNCMGQNWGNPENQMLNDSMSSFFYYSNNRPIPFSDPQSLIDTERRSKFSDDYHDQSEYELEYNRQVMQRQNQNYRKPYNSRNSNYKLHYLHRKNLK